MCKIKDLIMENEKSFIALLEKSIKKNWDANSLTDYKGVTYQYKDVARKIENYTSSSKKAASSRATRLPSADVTCHTGA